MCAERADDDAPVPERCQIPAGGRVRRAAVLRLDKRGIQRERRRRSLPGLARHRAARTGRAVAERDRRVGRGHVFLVIDAGPCGGSTPVRVQINRRQVHAAVDVIGHLDERRLRIEDEFTDDRVAGRRRPDGADDHRGGARGAVVFLAVDAPVQRDDGA